MTENEDLYAGEPSAAPQEPKGKKKKKIAVRIILGALVLLVVWVLYMLFHVYLTPNKRIQQIYLVPNHAALIIESSEPIEDWRKLSNSAPWQSLKQAPAFAYVAENAAFIDSLIHENKTLLSLLGKRDMIISLHQTKANDWDFLILIDMQNTSKIDVLKEQIEQILRLAGSTVTQRSYQGEVIVEMRDPDTREIFYMAFIDNHFAASYTSRLVEAAIDERQNPKIGLNDSFLRLDRHIAKKGLYRVYLNYAYLPQFLSIYIGDNDYVDVFCESMDFAGTWFDIYNDKIELKGQTLMKEEANPYVAAFIHSGHQKMKAHEIMSGRTASYANFGFSDPTTFIKELEKALQKSDKALYDSYTATRRKLESHFEVSLEKNFMEWMSGEFALTQSEPSLLGYEPELILAIRAKDIKEAQQNMEHLERNIRKKSPVKIKNVTYKGYKINYVELKGFFRLFFGSLFDRFEKPYYTYLEDYVVFSNKSASLLSFIEDYEQKNTLANNEGFKAMLVNTNPNSTILAYIDIQKFYPQLRPLLTPETWQKAQSNKEVLYSFPQWAFQVTSGKQEATLHVVMEHKPYELAPQPTVIVDTIDADDISMNEDTETEKELMSELKRFYVEKFEGNILREFYSSGALKSESETKDGKRNGRYREYDEDGALRVRGKYVNNQKKGVWKYYSENGKLERKEKY